MSSSILGGDVTVYYLDENRQQRLKWSGAATGTRTVNELYSALEDLMDEAPQSDDGSAMSAETPVEYTIGKIDAGELEPWFMSYDLAEHLTGGAIRTAGWTRATGTNAGIIVVPVTSNAIVDADVGFDIDGATTGHGTLLEVIEAGTTDYLIIRPNSSAAGDDFTTASQVITCNGNTATQSGAVSFTGEQIWSNLYNVTPIDADTHVYMYQGTVADGARARIQRISGAAGDWWPEGAFDRLIYIRNFKATSNPVIDAGYISVFARKGNTIYDSFEVSTSTVSGGRNPVPLKAATDINHTTGYQSITTTAVATDDFAVGDEIEGATSGARAIITLITGSNPTYTFHYYLIGDPQVTFQTAAETITNNDGTGSATKNGSAPANQGPALNTWFTSDTAPSITHANTTADIDNNGTTEGYGISIDCNQNPVNEVYEWLQYTTQNGGTTTTNTDGIKAEQYLGPTVYLEYSGSITGTILEGADVTQETSGATGIIVSLDTTKKQILLRDTRGTFITHATTATLTDNDNSGTVEINIAATTFGANTATPFGALAGGRFFGTRGVLLVDYLAADENKFQLITSNGANVQRPTSFTLELTNLVGGAETVSTSDLCSLFRLTGAGGSIAKTEFSATGGEIVGDTTITVDTAIPADVPGKTTGGTLFIRDFSDNNKDYRIRFASWTGSTFTLANIDIVAADAGTDTNTIVEAGAFATAKRGDLVVNKTRANAVSYVVTVDDANTIQIDPPIAGQTTADAIELNCVPITLATQDDVYVALMNRYATGAVEQVSLIYVATINYKAKVTNKRNSTKIKPFVTSDASSGTNRSIQVIRNTDTIAA